MEAGHRIAISRSGSDVMRSLKKKVCIFTTVHPAFDNRIFYKEAKSLVRFGYNVTLIQPGSHDEIVDGVRIVALRACRDRLRRLLWSPFRVLRLALRERALIYHFHDPELIPCALVIRLLGNRVIYDVHEDVPKHILYKSWVPLGCRSSVGWLMRHLEAFCARWCSAVVVAHPQIQRRLGPLNRRTVVVQNFPRIEEFEFSSQEALYAKRGPEIADFGGITRKRVIREVVEALNLLPAELGVRLILGGGCRSQSLRREVTGLPGWDRVEYVGQIPREDMIRRLGSAAAALVLYNREPNHLDVRSNRLFESLAAGVPVITPNFPKWRELVARIGCGLTVDPEDPRSIASAIEYLVTHPKESSEMGRRGRQAVLDKFNWHKEELKLLALYGQITDARRRFRFVRSAYPRLRGQKWVGGHAPRRAEDE